MNHAGATSPRIAALEAALLTGNVDALTAFRVETSTRGTPLIERIEDDDQNVLATFV
jgi:hypothetical protein